MMKIVKKWVKNQLCWVLGLPAVAERISSITRSQTSYPHMEVLPGTQYSKYLVPIEYLPSRTFLPRWGYGTPPIESITSLFSKNDDAYVSTLKNIRLLKKDLSNIPNAFLPENLPAPGWCGIPISPIDSALLYYFITHYRPKTYIEIGSGVTTCFVHRAINDHGLDTQIISIDPQPRSEIDKICNRTIRKGLEDCDLSIFSKLNSGDIVFFDGTHRSFMNSDVTVFMIDILP